MKPDMEIDSLRTEHESDEQWAVRRSFMLEHKEKFTEQELVTLAQLYTNIEFLGCRNAVKWIARRIARNPPNKFFVWDEASVTYPPETMKRIAQLSEKVSAEYQASRKNKLKRTFVQASDAAEQKAKRTFKK